MRKLVFIFSLILLVPVFLSAQIGREFKTVKVNGDVVQSLEKFYENVALDENGAPVLPEKGAIETLNFYQDGYLIESQNFEYQDSVKALSSRVLLKRDGEAIRLAEIYTYHHDKESLLRSHEAVIKNGKLISEKIRNDKKDLGTVQYAYGKTTKGLDFESIAADGNNAAVVYYTESDEHGLVFSMETMGTDTLIQQYFLENQGDTLRKSLIISRNSGNISPDSVLVIERTWLDHNGNPILNLKQMEALSEPPAGEPKTANFVSSFTYEYDKNIAIKAPVLPDQETIFGAWQSRANNLELFFEPESVNGKPRMYGTSYLSKSNEPTVEELLEAGEIWKYMLKQDFAPGTWSLDKNGELTIILNNSSILLFSAEMDFKTLVLKPKMKDMKGELRLVKSL